MSHIPELSYLGVHAPFFARNKDYLSAIRREVPREKLFQLAWLLLMGDWHNNPAVRIARKFGCYLNCHSSGFIYEKGIEMLIENAARHETAIKDPLIISRFARENDIGITLDVCHIHDCGYDVLDVLNIINPSVIHLSDAPQRGDTHAHLPILKGKGVSIKDFLHQLRKRDKDVIIILEYKPLHKHCWEQVITRSINGIYKIFDG